MQTPQPIQIISEIFDTVTSSCSWVTEPSSDNGIKEGLLEEQKEDSKKESFIVPEGKKEKAELMHPPVFSIPYSREVRHNFSFLASLMKPTDQEIKEKEVILPPRAIIGKLSNKTLILDMDDTLIHTINPQFDYAAINVAHEKFSSINCIDSDNKKTFKIDVVIRPFAIELLKELSSIYEIIVIVRVKQTRFSLPDKNIMLSRCSAFWIQKSNTSIQDSSAILVL